ncbi:hypothetical protein PINS_up022447 [Pythium insidiosum]|nr:hypothetical protein PINS_up022447 [Pythium insidiosum]
MGHTGRGAQREGFWRIVFHPTMQQVCREVLQPMKVFMTRELFKVVRAPANWISDEAFEDDWESFCSSDLVVGLTASGFLVGFFYMVRNHEMLRA